MKTLLLTAAAAFFMFNVTYSQTTQEQMTTIDKTKKEIDNSMDSYQKTIEQKNGTSTKTVYMDGCELKLVTIAIIENGIAKSVNLYFTNGALMYATQVGTSVKTGNIVGNDVTYVNNNQALSWTTNGNVAVDSSSRKFKSMNTELMAYAFDLEKGISVNASIPLVTK